MKEDWDEQYRIMRNWIVEGLDGTVTTVTANRFGNGDRGVTFFGAPDRPYGQVAFIKDVKSVSENGISSAFDDGRYTIDELKTSFRQLDHTSGEYYAKRLDDAALQARKNRGIRGA